VRLKEKDERRRRRRRRSRRQIKAFNSPSFPRASLSLSLSRSS